MIDADEAITKGAFLQELAENRPFSLYLLTEKN